MTNNNEELVKDPVCGMVRPASQMKEQTTYQDKVYYFCLQVDKDIFLAHPERWVPKK